MTEQIPHWLKLLLAKYGEKQGPIIGLEQTSVEEGQDEDALDPGELSNLLQQMAESPETISPELTPMEIFSL